MMKDAKTGKVSNRSDLRTTLESKLIAPEEEEESMLLGEVAEQRSVKPKTYLIESNTDLKHVAMNGYKVVPTDDPSLWNILATSKNDSFYIYLDTLDPRFWVLHSTYYADESDAVVKSLITGNSSKLDSAWLSSDTLLDLSRGKPTMGFGINYTNLFVPESEKAGLSARVWGREVPNVLKGLRKITQIENQISVSSVTLRSEIGVGFVNEDIFRDGKLTAKGGDSIDNHLALIDSVVTNYRGLIEGIEREYVTRYQRSEHYCTIQGTYSVIEFSAFIPNLPYFAEVLTSGTEPFRLWGVSRPITPNHFRLHVIDLHTNTPVELELMPDELRIILGEGACGNVVPRLFTNIQARFDSNCKLRGLDSAYIIRPHQAS
jgi:hypothetical protein